MTHTRKEALEALLGEIEESDDILDALISAIRGAGMYSPETTITFLNGSREALFRARNRMGG